MSKRLRYPSYQENPARKALCGLRFVDPESAQVFSDTHNDGLKETQQRYSQAITEEIVAAMGEIYTMTYKNWVNKYWHSALKPNLSACLNGEQRKIVLDAYDAAVAEECRVTLDNILRKDTYADFSDQLAGSLSGSYHHTAKFLLYAKNFELRTAQKTKMIFILEKMLHIKGRQSNLVSQAKLTFGELVLSESLKQQITQEIHQAIHQNTNLLLSRKHKSPPANEDFRLQLVYPSLLARTLNSLFCSPRIEGLDPLAITWGCILDVIRSNIKLAGDEQSLPFALPFTDLHTLEHEEGMPQHLEATLVPLMSNWLERIRQWTDFGLRAIEISAKLSKCSLDINAKNMIGEVVKEELQNSLELTSEALAIFMIYSAHKTPGEGEAWDALMRFDNGLGGSTEAVTPGSSFLNESVDFQERLADKLYAKIVDYEASPDSQLPSKSKTQRLVVLSKAISYAEIILGEVVHLPFMAKIRSKLSKGDVYATLYRDLIAKQVDESSLKDVIIRFGLSPQLPEFQEFAKAPSGWEEKQYTALIQATIVSLLPKELGGSSLSPLLARRAFNIIASDSEGLFGTLPSIIIEKVQRAQAESEGVVLNSGIFLCSEDPSLTEETPSVFLTLLNDALSLIVPKERWNKSWHPGWSAVKCRLSLGDSVHVIQCSVLHFEMLQRLIEASRPLDAKMLLPSITDSEYVEATAYDFAKSSDGLIKDSFEEGRRIYALDVTSNAKNASFLHPRVSDHI